MAFLRHHFSCWFFCCSAILEGLTCLAVWYIYVRRSLRSYLSLLLLSISTNSIKPTQIFCTKSLQPLCKGLIHRTLPAVFHTNNPLLLYTMASTNITSSLVDSPTKIAALLDSIHALTTFPHEIPSLYLDAEGTRLSRNGTLAILQMLVPPLSHVYLVDVTVLGALAFSTPSSKKGSSFTLKTVLESADTLKVFFDVRNDSDALFSLYGIRLAGTTDLQLMELAARNDGRKWLRGLKTCIERHSGMTANEMYEWLTGKEKGRELFAPESGGSYEVFSQRPLREEVWKYCVQDVVVMPQLWIYYEARLSAKWKGIVLKTSRERIAESQRPGYDGEGRHRARGPWPCYDGWEDTVQL